MSIAVFGDRLKKHVQAVFGDRLKCGGWLKS